jgi:hypothetical protein
LAASADLAISRLQAHTEYRARTTITTRQGAAQNGTSGAAPSG